MEKVTAIFIPSLNRPHHIVSILSNIKETTPEPHEVYFMVSDGQSIAILSNLKVKYFVDDPSMDTRYVTRMNYLYQHTTEPLMFTGSDDIRFHPHWLTNALKYIDGNIQMVIPNDLLNPNGTECLVTRDYIASQSGCIDTPDVLFYPNYQHQFADTEQFETASKRGVLAHAPDSIVEHLHFVNGKADIDDTYRFSYQNEDKDRQLFAVRRHLWS